VEQVHTDADGHRHVTTWEHHPGTEHPVAQSERLGAAGDDRRFSSVVTDAVGTATELLGSDGAAVWQHRASLWGVPLDDAGPDATPLRFPGQYLDAETGLHYNVFRYYDPVTGRYLSQDPLGLAPAPNPVAYVANPLSAADPLGLAPTTGGCGGAGGAGGTPARPGSTDEVDRVRDTRSDRGTPNGSEEAPAAPGEGTSRPDAERSDSPERSDDSVDTPQGEPAPVRHPALDQPFNPNPPRPDFVYHGSSIEDKVIFKSGILSPAALKGIQPDYNLPEYVRNPKDKHGFVSTTDNFDVALQFIRGTPDGPRKTANDGIFDKYFSGKTPETFQQRKGWVYAIDTRPIKGQPEMPLIHVPSQNVAERFKYQDEWATLDRVPPERITGAYRIDGFFTPKATPEGRVKIDVYKGEDTKTLNKGFIPRDINEFNL
jgi:RHS repeat-associated protein